VNDDVSENVINAIKLAFNNNNLPLGDEFNFFKTDLNIKNVILDTLTKICEDLLPTLKEDDSIDILGELYSTIDQKG